MCIVAAFSSINLKVELERSLNLYFLSSFILKPNKTDTLNCFLANAVLYTRALLKFIRVLAIYS